MYRKDRYSYQALRSSTYRIGAHITVYGARNVISFDNEGEVKLQPRLISVLTVLAAAHGEVVSRQQLIDTVWSEFYTGDLALNQSISKLRRILGDAKTEPEIIETIVKTGYRLIPRVSYGAAKKTWFACPAPGL